MCDGPSEYVYIYIYALYDLLSDAAAQYSKLQRLTGKAGMICFCGPQRRRRAILFEVAAVDGSGRHDFRVL